MPSYAAPGVYFETVDAGKARVPAVRTDIAAFVGVAGRGPQDTPTVVYSWAQFQARFGDFMPGPYLAYSTKAFFENGGQECHIVRVAAKLATTTTDPIAIQPADRSASIVLSTVGFAPGAVVSVFQAPNVEENALLTDVDSLTRTLTWAHPLKPAFNVALPMTFETGAGAAWSTLMDALGAATMRIEAESAGAWGNYVTVHVAHSSRAATRTRAAALQTTAASSVESVTGIAAHSLIKVFQDQSPAPSVEFYHTGSPDPVGNRLVWDTPLEAAFNLAQPISFEVVEFSIAVYERGKLLELFEGLSLIPGHVRYVSTVNSSVRIRVTDLASGSPVPDNLPVAATVRLHSGRDGIAALLAGDFTGDPGAEERLGLRTLELDYDVAAVAIPDILMRPAPPVEFAAPPPSNVDPCLPCSIPEPEAPPPPPAVIERIPGFGLDTIARVQQQLVEHCEAMKYRVALLDPPDSDFAGVQTWRQRFDSKYAALYFPWLMVYDPLRWRNRVVCPVPPSGHVAGIYARTDFERGVHCAPANQEVQWAQAAESVVDAARQGILNPDGIDCFRAFPGRGVVLYGARTVSSLPAWIFVNVRRLFILIEKSLDIALQWTVFEPNDVHLRHGISLAVTSFLRMLWKRGALKGRTQDEAFRMQFEPIDDPGQLILTIGVAPTIPAEFVVFRIGKAAEVLGVTE